MILINRYNSTPWVLDSLCRTMSQKIPVVHMIGQAHLDPVWLWPWTEGRAEALATCYAAVNCLKAYPEFHYTRARPKSTVGLKQRPRNSGPKSVAWWPRVAGTWSTAW